MNRAPATPADLHAEVLEVARTLIRFDTTNGNETPAAEYLADYLSAQLSGTDAEGSLEVELVARDPARANLVARLPADPAHLAADPGSLAFVGHLDVVPADPRDWTHPPFAAVVDEAGYLFGRGAVDMKDEVAARVVAFAELARTGFRPRADLWLVMVADEEDGAADVGMRWLLEHRPDIRPVHAVNEGGGSRLVLADGRTVATLAVGEKGTQPVRVTALGEAGHASMPTLGTNAVPVLGQLLTRIGRGLPTLQDSPLLRRTLTVLLGEPPTDLAEGLDRASALHPVLRHELPPLGGTTMAPTLLSGSAARNVMPARAWMELDCRILPGTGPDDVARSVRERLGTDLPFDLDFPEPAVLGSSSPAAGPVPDAVAAFLAEHDPEAAVLPLLCTGFTDSNFLRAAGGTAAYGFSPFRSTPVEVLESGYHNADERVHVDDLLLAVQLPPRPGSAAAGLSWDPCSAGQEREPDLAHGIVDVEIDQADALPGAQCEPTTEHRYDGEGRDEGRQHVRAAMAATAVPVSPPVVGGQQVGQRGQQVLVAARTGLEDRDAGGRVRHEHVEQSVVAAPHEAGHLVSQVQDDLVTSRVAGEGLRVHGPILARPPARRPTRPMGHCGWGPLSPRGDCVAHGVPESPPRRGNPLTATDLDRLRVTATGRGCRE